MGEKCGVDDSRECSQSERLGMMEARLQTLERDREKEQEFRVVYYRDREERAKHDTRIDEKMDSVQNDLKNVLAWVEEQKNKPNKLVDGIFEKLVWAALALVGGILLAKFGIGG